MKIELKNGVLHVEMPKSKEEPKKNASNIEVHIYHHHAQLLVAISFYKRLATLG